VVEVEKMAFSASDKSHDKGWLKAIKKGHRGHFGSTRCVNYKADCIY
jgi:hypothetical protein